MQRKWQRTNQVESRKFSNSYKKISQSSSISWEKF